MQSEWAMGTQGLIHNFGKRQVVKGLDLKVPHGCVYGFLGRNGAGKTTTIRLLMGMLRASGGTISYEGSPQSHILPEMRKQIGYVSQEQHFYDWMKVSQLGDFVRGFYDSWDPEEFHRLLELLKVDANQRVRELSGGTKAKLAIALALVHKPKILLLDEPTAGVDPIARREILEILRNQAEQEHRTVFFSTHHISEVEQIGHWVGILHDGRMAYQGPVDQLQLWFRKGPGPMPSTVHTIEMSKGVQLGYASPEVWSSVDSPVEPATLDDAFFAITRDAR